jgi:carboxymethylenebutenolidase
MSITTKWIDIQGDDGTFGAYVAVPHTGSGPGIVLLQEIFGVNEHIRSVAEQYAADGFVVLVPDLFWRAAPRIELGYDEASMPKAYELYQGLDFDKTQADITLAAKTLRALPEVTGKIASVGFCLGGLLSYKMAAGGAVDLAVAYYGGGIQNQLELADSVTVPLQLHFGDADSHIPNDAVATIAAKLESKDNVEIHIYPGADHGFNCSHRGSYHMLSALQAHGNTLLFLAENL